METEKFAPNGKMIVKVEGTKVHVLTDEDRRTLVLGPSARQVDADAIGEVLKGITWHTDLWVAMIIYRDKYEGSYILSEIKPVYSDMTWEEWCSEEQIAKEYYSYQERLKKRGR